MKKTVFSMGIIALLSLSLAACAGTTNESSPSPAAGDAGQAGGTATNSSTVQQQEQGPRTIHYLGKEYTVPAKPDKIVITGSFEAMEDALVLGVQPIGASTIGGKFPEMFASITGSTQPIGEKIQPNMETILKLKPDVILGSSKFKPEVGENLAKIATTLPVSHISTDWETNLRMLAELTGKQDQVEKVLQTYKDDVSAAKAQLGDKLKDKKVVVIRVRTGNIMIYQEDLFFNPSLYEDLGLPVPEQVKAAKAQEIVSLEKFSEMNPDYLFVQFAEDENKEQPAALADLEKNPIWKSMNAVKNGHVFVNVVDPLAQGGTAWSKINFLKAAVEKLAGK